MFAAGGYAAALLFNKAGLTDMLLLAAVGGAAGALIAAPFAPLLARYRGIFFAMLTLACPWCCYGLLMKTEAMGGSDGFNVGRATLFGWKAPDARSHYLLWAVTGDRRVRADGPGARLRFAARPAVAGRARQRAAHRIPRHLGGQHRRLELRDRRRARAASAGAGGDGAGPHRPELQLLDDLGEFVFVAILAGHHSVVAVLASSFLLELVRSFSSSTFPTPGSWRWACSCCW